MIPSPWALMVSFFAAAVLLRLALWARARETLWFARELARRARAGADAGLEACHRRTCHEVFTLRRRYRRRRFDSLRIALHAALFLERQAERLAEARARPFRSKRTRALEILTAVAPWALLALAMPLMLLSTEPPRASATLGAVLAWLAWGMNALLDPRASKRRAYRELRVARDAFRPPALRELEDTDPGLTGRPGSRRPPASGRQWN